MCSMLDIPLKDRIYVSKTSTRGPTVTYANHTSNRPLTYKSWNKSSITTAVTAVATGQMSQRRAAEEFGIPRSTLGDHVRGRVLPGAKSGNPKYLSDQEEVELSRFLLKCSSVGFPRSRKDVLAIVQRACNSKGREVNVTHGWWESYLKRHPELALRTAASVSAARAKASDPEVISTYFDMLEKCLVEYDLLDKPAQIFNLDESGMPLEHLPPKAVCMKGTRNPLCITSGNKAHITVVACVNAAGWCIPPMIIWDRKTMHQDMAAGEVRCTLHAFSENGWIDSELFDIWFECQFLRYAPPVRPLLLLMDGHSTHYCPNTIRTAA